MATSLVRKVLHTKIGQLFQPTSVIGRPVQRCLSCLSPPVTHTQIVQKNITSPQPCQNQFGQQSLLLKVCLPFMNSIRTVVRYSRRRGKPKTVRAVTQRFMRLDWGIYIRARAGRHKKRWTKPDWINERSKYHVFCNKQQSRMLDKMTTKYWKKKRHYVDDPYQVYQQRTALPGHYTPPKYFP